MADDWEATEISRLFPEILTIIFSFLDVQDKGRAAQVCRAWKDAAYSRQVWRGVSARLHIRRANPSLFHSLEKRGIKKVEVLSLRRSLRDVILGIPFLESLNLSGCYNVTDIGLRHTFIEDFPNLTHLNLSLCKQVTDRSLGRISQYVRNLESLELGGCCNITSNGLMLLAYGVRKLRLLNLRSCRQISDQGLGFLAGHESSNQNPFGTLQLTTLVLQDCQRLSDAGLKYVTDLRNLHSINLSFCGSITDGGLRLLAKMKSLREINVRSCFNISDLGVGYLADGGSRITNLDVSFCDRIGDQSLEYISQGLCQLHSLSLCACNISDDGVGNMSRALQDLHTLNIGQCVRVTDKGISLICEHLLNIQYIDLYGCTGVTTVGLERVTTLPKLCTLNLGLWHKHESVACNCLVPPPPCATNISEWTRLFSSTGFEITVQ